MNFPNGSRAYVDNQTTFILGEGSNLTIGKVGNTAGIIGVEGNGKIKINEYKGKDLYNHDNLTTIGGSIGVDFGKSGAKVNGIGINNENHSKEGITRHTVIGNVEIGSATGSPINRDRSKANETTRDDHSSTNVYVESQTIVLWYNKVVTIMAEALKMKAGKKYIILQEVQIGIITEMEVQIGSPIMGCDTIC